MNKDLETIVAAGSIAILFYLLAKGISENQNVIACPICGERILANTILGNQIRCPKCNNQLAIPR
jgi:DNA-directed RNA polymerase subunit RPC12/RpoP